LSVARRLVFSLLLVYVAFNLSWGLNYDRRGIADQLQLHVHRYDTKELAFLLQLIVTRLNELDSPAREHRSALATKHNLSMAHPNHTGTWRIRMPALPILLHP